MRRKAAHEVPEEVRARKFVLVDEGGRDVAALGMERGAVLFEMRDSRGRPRVQVKADKTMTSLVLRRPDGRQVSIEVAKKYLNLVFARGEKDEQTLAYLVTGDDGATLFLGTERLRRHLALNVLPEHVGINLHDSRHEIAAQWLADDNSSSLDLRGMATLKDEEGHEVGVGRISARLQASEDTGLEVKGPRGEYVEVYCDVAQNEVGARFRPGESQPSTWLYVDEQGSFLRMDDDAGEPRVEMYYSVWAQDGGFFEHIPPESEDSSDASDDPDKDRFDA